MVCTDHSVKARSSQSCTGGSVVLNSTDPFAFPSIDPNFFATDFDQQVMLQAVKFARQFVQAQPWAGFVAGRTGPVGDAETDAAIIAASRQAIVTIFHPTSTAGMSPVGANFGVVDPDLLLKGASGIRVVDASIFVSHAPMNLLMIDLDINFSFSLSFLRRTRLLPLTL